ncbi:hypothetical protein BDW75DRAFT_225940 [Aspergillus navahoensis]
MLPQSNYNPSKLKILLDLYPMTLNCALDIFIFYLYFPVGYLESPLCRESSDSESMCVPTGMK